MGAHQRVCGVPGLRFDPLLLDCLTRIYCACALPPRIKIGAHAGVAGLQITLEGDLCRALELLQCERRPRRNPRQLQREMTGSLPWPVGPARLERATSCSGGKRSIQLSYGP